ncbi:hypothetical protein Tco_0750023 [Tanacetum coccineum]|uniref:Uncharacterized protein n=1 Tax=Tanacetum coccineum TaxID=301880 RepID=A0ABQ4Z2T4_9ASTR
MVGQSVLESKLVPKYEVDKSSEQLAALFTKKGTLSANTPYRRSSIRRKPKPIPVSQDPNTPYRRSSIRRTQEAQYAIHNKSDTPYRGGSRYHQKDRKPSQNDKTEHGMEKTVQNQGQSPKMPKSEPELKNTIGCNLNPSDGPGKPNSITMKTVKTKWALNQFQQPICV